MEKRRAGNYRGAAVGPVIETEIKREAGSDLAAQRLRIARFLADLLDQRITIPGTSIRVGLDPILGLVPGVGDLLANVTGSAILLIAAQFNIPKIVLLRMGLNIAVNSMIGAIPIFGDIFSIWFRSNVKNVQLLERYAGAHHRKSTVGHGLFVIALLAGLLVIIFGILAGLAWLIGQFIDSVFGGSDLNMFLPLSSS